MDRTPIESLFNISLGLRKPFESEPERLRSNSLVFYNRASGEVIGFLDTFSHRLYDCDGNFFKPSQN